MRQLTALLKSKGGEIGPLAWVRWAIPTAVFLAILFWVMLVFMNEGFWTFRDAVSLPVAKPQSGHVDRGMDIRIVINRAGLISIGDNGVTTQALTAILEKVKMDRGGNLVYVDIRADAAAAWQDVQPVMTILRTVGYHETSFLTRTGEGWPSRLRVFVDRPPENNSVTIVCDGKELAFNGKLCSRQKLREILSKEYGRTSDVCLWVGPKSTVQDAVNIIGIYNEHLVKEPLCLIEDPPLETTGSVEQPP